MYIHLLLYFYNIDIVGKAHIIMNQWLEEIPYVNEIYLLQSVYVWHLCTPFQHHTIHDSESSILYQGTCVQKLWIAIGLGDTIDNPNFIQIHTLYICFAEC